MQPLHRRTNQGKFNQFQTTLPVKCVPNRLNQPKLFAKLDQKQPKKSVL